NVYWIGARFTADLRRRVYEHLLTLSPGFFEETRTGEVSSRVTNDVTLVEAVMGGTMLYALRMAITMVGCVAMLFFTSVKLTLLIAAVIVLAFGAVGVLLWVGAHDVFAGRLSVGSLTAFLFYAVIVANATFVLAEVYGELQRAAGASERLTELLATEPHIRAPANPVALPAPALGRVQFEEVTFRYPSRPDTAALDHFSLDVAPGEVIALVGPSGAGKTTVFQLLLRFYDPSSGRIRIDGVDARAADPRELRRRVAVVAQEPVIFAASVADNVRYGRPEATEHEV